MCTSLANADWLLQLEASSQTNTEQQLAVHCVADGNAQLMATHGKAQLMATAPKHTARRS